VPGAREGPVESGEDGTPPPIRLLNKARNPKNEIRNNEEKTQEEKGGNGAFPAFLASVISALFRISRFEF